MNSYGSRAILFRCGMAPQPYFGLIMKMTMHIDEDVLDRVMKLTGAKTKTAAVELALKDMARRHKMKELFTAGLGLTADELKEAFDPRSYPETPESSPM